MRSSTSRPFFQSGSKLGWMVEVTFELDSLGRLTCLLADEAGRAVVTASNMPAAADDLLAALRSADRGEVGERFWQEGGGQYRWLLRRRQESVEVVVLWSTGTVSGWENVFWRECAFGSFARSVGEQIERIRNDLRAVPRERKVVMAEDHPERVHFEGSQPILRVENMEASVRFYVDMLGFENASWGTDEFTSVSRDNAGIYLCQGGQGKGGAWVWIGVDDAEKLYEEYTRRGVAIRLPPTNYSWALEMQLEDPDGNVLRLGSEPR